MAKIWYLYPALSASMPFQMAFDEILFRRFAENSCPGFSRPILRFYFSSEPWETVGYARKLLVSGERRGPPVCRRITGGGRVLHGKDLIFSLFARKADDASFRSVRSSYLKIHEAVKTAFESLGKSPRFYRCHEHLPKGDDCFDFPIASDIAVEGEKAAGGAQKRSSGVLLHQESVRLKQAEPDGMIAALKAGFEGVFKIKLQPADLSAELLAEAEDLSLRKCPNPESLPEDGKSGPVFSGVSIAAPACERIL